MTKNNDPQKSAADYASMSMTTLAGSGPDATNIVAQYNVDITKGQKHIDDEMDLIADALARQREVGNIASYEENIFNCTKQVGIFEEDIKGMENRAAASWKSSKRTGKPELNSNDDKRKRELLKEINRLKESRQEWQNKLVYALELRDGKAAKAVKTA